MVSTIQNRFEDRVVAFVDILGFREIVEKMAKSSKSFEDIRDILKKIQQQEKKIRRERLSEKQAQSPKGSGRVSLLPPSRLEMTAFSDCYVISDRVESGWQVLSIVPAMAVFLLSRGIMLRGGIVRGRAYHRGRVVFGPGVITAYELEQHTAKYPRIIVEDHLVRSEGWWLKPGKFFLRDADGCWFINPFEPNQVRHETGRNWPKSCRISSGDRRVYTTFAIELEVAGEADAELLE